MGPMQTTSNADWWNYASCKGIDTESFFSRSPEKIEIALAVCQGCFVKAACRITGDSEEKLYGHYCWGVRGGETAEQRKARRGYSSKGWSR